MFNKFCGSIREDVATSIHFFCYVGTLFLSTYRLKSGVNLDIRPRNEFVSRNQPRRCSHQFFWGAKGILFVDYLQTGKTINSEYYCNVLGQLIEKNR